MTSTEGSVSHGGDERPHGVIASYRAGCRCSLCRAANAAEARAARQRRLGRTPPTHGLGGAQNWGCRCDTCSAALREQNAKTAARQKARRAAQPKPVVTERTCRTCQRILPIEDFPRNGKSSRRRQCHECYRQQQRQADARYRREHAERRSAAETARAKRLRETDPEYRARRNSAALRYSHEQAVATVPTAVNHRKEWTGPELEVIARPELTAVEAARLLGRTAAAVKVQRHLLRDDPRKARLAGLDTPVADLARP